MRAHALRLVILAMIGCGGGGAGGAAPPADPAPPTAPSDPTPGGGPAAATPAGACVQVPWEGSHADVKSVGETSYAGKLDSATVRLDEVNPNNPVEQVLVLELDKPVCLPAGRDAKETGSIHVYGTDAKVHQQLRALKGKHIVVTGKGFEPQTAHHHRPLVVEVKQLSVQ